MMRFKELPEMWAQEKESDLRGQALRVKAAYSGLRGVARRNFDLYQHALEEAAAAMSRAIERMREPEGEW